ISAMSHDFDQALTADGIPHTTWFYGAGTHDWPYWRDDLARFLPQVLHAFRAPPPAPPAIAFSYETAAPSFAVWGWRFTAHRSAPEMTYLDDVRGRGLDVRGSGTVAVTTATLYARGARYRVTGAGAHPVDVIADH